jgi:predicted nucleotide-binding protein (sugar kinase/HSP70/actin superfamily)
MTSESTKAGAELDVERALAEFEATERARLGLDVKRAQWTDSMVDPQFRASERPHTTILVGGLTMAHDYLVEGALRGLGYAVRALDCPDTEALRFGKEFGNRGQCNPTYFTVGNLVKELCRLRDEEGLSTERILKEYVFLTAGACGPCRFGMYVTEYRKALRDAGFDGFRVMLFQQTGGLKQATGEEAGLDLSPPFFLAIAKALFAGDVINLAGYALRPYEVEAGATDRALAEAKAIVHRALAERTNVYAALWRAGRVLRAVEVDRLRAKPKVAVLGEFWAMTTEGDGNYRLQRFLEEEGAENQIQILAHLLLYNLWEIRHDTRLRASLRGTDGGPFGLEGTDVGLKMAGLYVGELALRGVFHSFALALGLRGVHLPDMDRLAAVGDPHYDVALRGGEGHLEVAKLIVNVVDRKAHMTLSVKPFGCMPSSGVSDGVQSAITERYPDAIFCAVETSGDGAVNFYSRVQMFLFKARQKAREEFDAALAQYGVTADEVRAHLARTRYRDGLIAAPHRVAGTAADLVHELGPVVAARGAGRLRARAGRWVDGVRHAVAKDGAWAMRFSRELAPYLPSLGRWIASEAVDYLAPGAKGAWDKHVRARLWPTEEERASVARAEAAERLRDAEARGKRADATSVGTRRGADDVRRLEVVPSAG